MYVVQTRKINNLPKAQHLNNYMDLVYTNT